MNLAWKLDLVLSGRAEERLLDTYTSERLPQVQSYIHFSVELGKIICITDSEAARMRDQQMVAGRQQAAQGGLPQPSFLPGPGFFLEGDPLAGQMFLQREVARDSSRGLFDDLVGRSFCLISTVGNPAQHLSADDLAFFTSIGGQSVSLSSSENEHVN